MSDQISLILRVHLPADSGEQLDKLYAALQAHPNRRLTDAIKLIVWTGTRKNEVLGAKWAEFDFATGIWIIPNERAKTKRAVKIRLNYIETYKG